MRRPESIHAHLLQGFRDSGAGGERRIGAELKFPLVRPDGQAVDYATVDALWDYLVWRGWRPAPDKVTGKIVGARKAGPRNDTVASCETGYCKSEFSLAHTADLVELDRAVRELREELEGFCEARGVHFLGYGIQPLTPPGERLLMKKRRTSVWDKVFKSNRHIPEDEGDDLHLFTINAASHVHVSVSLDEAVPLINVLNGFAGAQIALTAHSNIWRGRLDPDYKCVAEKFWDWWIPESGRVGIPLEPFADLADYAAMVGSFHPVYVVRDGLPLVLTDYGSFADYYAQEEAIGTDLSGTRRAIVPEPADIDVHSTCYWFNARLSHYYTVENRVNDQQTPDALMCIPALTVGLAAALKEAQEELRGHDWETLRQAREAACADGLDGRVNGLSLRDLAGRLVELAALGLRRRKRGEEVFLEPLTDRVRSGRCPADRAADHFESGGIAALIDHTKL